MVRQLLPLTLLSLFFLSQTSTLHAQSDTLYVRANAIGANDGTSWENAFTDLRMALDSSEAGDKVWVAQGIYRPDTLGGDSTSSFFIGNDIQLFGGYAGEGAMPDERDPNAYLTTLSGDLAGDDVLGDLDSNRTDNVLTVLLVGNAVTEGAAIDGFYIEGGHAAGDDTQFQYRRGGGVFSFGSPAIRGCVFQNNFANAEGGALYFHTSGSEGSLVEDCFFTQNQAEDGGAVNIFVAGGVGVTFENCEFVENIANRSGGALRVYNSNCYIDGCAFQFNFAERGGAVEVQSIFDDNETVIQNSLITENAARQGGGVNFQTNSGLGAHNNFLRLDVCDFIGNIATYTDTTQQGGRQGGAIRIVIDRTTNGCGATIKNTFIINSSSDGAAGAIFARLEGQDMEFLFQHSEIAFSQTDNNGVLQLTTTDVGTGTATIDNSQFTDNTSNQNASGIFIEANGSSSVDFSILDCVFEQNVAQQSGGALWLLSRDTAQLNLNVERCQFAFNVGVEQGGALALRAQDGQLHSRFRNCVFWQNVGDFGASIAGFPSAIGASNLTLENCLFFENIGLEGTIAIDSFENLRMVNCTVAGNLVSGLQTTGTSSARLLNNIFYNPGYQEFIAMLQIPTVTSGGGNLIFDNSMDGILGMYDQSGIDPEFSPSGNDPFLPMPTSPAIDAGVLLGDVWEEDILGNPRVNGCIDAGAYESLETVSTDCLTATEELESERAVRIFPNPASDELHVVLPWANDFEMQILDVNGRILRSEKITGREIHSLDVSNLKSGVYFLKMTGEQGRIVRRIVVE